MSAAKTRMDRAVHFDTRPIGPADFEPEPEAPAPLLVACGSRTAKNASTTPTDVTCSNCLRSMPKPVELVEFVATFYDNPNIDACPECLPAVAEILDANPDKEPSELELPHCDFCDDLRLVYIQPPRATPSPENAP